VVTQLWTTGGAISRAGFESRDHAQFGLETDTKQKGRWSEWSNEINELMLRYLRNEEREAEGNW